MTLPPAGSRSAGIRLDGLTKSYPSPRGPVPAVRGVDIAVAAGETVALLGPNIAGKLFLSEGTVRNYLSAAIAKTGVRNRIEAIKVADERGWL